MNKTNNPCGARGLAFIEFAAADPLFLRELFASFGLSLVRQNGSRSKQYWR
jgi:4-hydroxyphenylpyruvate dioxygenase-like putative hemolysin